MVSLLAFYSQVRIPLKPIVFSVKFVFEKSENKQKKRVGLAHFLKKDGHQIYELLSSQQIDPNYALPMFLSRFRWPRATRQVGRNYSEPVAESGSSAGERTRERASVGRVAGLTCRPVCAQVSSSTIAHHRSTTSTTVNRLKSGKSSAVEGSNIQKRFNSNNKWMRCFFAELRLLAQS